MPLPPDAPAPSGPRVLVVDDEPLFVRLLERLLRGAGCEVHPFTSAAEALAALPSLDPDVVVSDIQMPELSGTDLLEAVKRGRPDVEVVLLTAFGTVDAAVAALKRGAYDYLTKPIEDAGKLIRVVGHAAERKRLVGRAAALEKLLDPGGTFSGIVGQGQAMRAVFKLIESVAASSSTVLIEGESGTGKELVARAIHDRSPRKGRAFVPVNCGALPEAILESELFGHVKGAFTGAVAARRGLFETADGGTLFLDEIGEMPLNMQVKLLRTVQEGEVRPVGATHSASVDVRLIAATNVDLRAAVAKGAFREDLYYRLNVINVRLPPLRERAEDVPILAAHFLAKHSALAGKRHGRFAPEVLEALAAAPWKGNVRELENVIERAVVMAQGDTIQLGDLPAELARRAVGGGPVEGEVLSRLPYARARVAAMRAFERRYLGELMAEHGGNVSSAARAAGMDRSNFRRILKKHHIAAVDD